MTLPTTNPFFQNDIDIIIQNYSKPSADIVPTQLSQNQTLPVIRSDTSTFNPALQELSRMTSQIVRSPVNSLLASHADNLQSKIDQAQGVIASLWDYKTDAADAEKLDLGFASMDLSGTTVSLKNAKNLEQVAGIIFADCIPCKDRILALAKVNPLKDFMNIAEGMYDQMTAGLFDLIDFITGNFRKIALADLCSLLKFLNFMCLPDLAGIITVLSRLITKYTLKLENIRGTLMSFLARITGPSLSSLVGLFDRYMQLIIAPIECVIDALDAQLQKIDVVQAWQIASTGEQANRTVSMNKASQYVASTRKDIENTTSKLSGSLRLLEKYLRDAVEEGKEELKKLEDAMLDFLGIQKESDKELMDLSYHIEMVANLIGLVQAVAYALNNKILCDDRSNTQELESFLGNIIAPYFDMDMVSRDGIVTLTPKIPNNMTNIYDIIGQYNKQADQKATPTTQEELKSQNQIVIPLKNCLYTVTDAELESVKSYLGTFA